jgi:hypothetical protein
MQVSQYAANGSLPWLGVIERVLIYSYLLWVAMLAVILLRAQSTAPQVDTLGTNEVEHNNDSNHSARHTGQARGGEEVKKVTAFVGSARKKHTYHAVSQFLSSLQSLGDVEYEIVDLSDYRLETCRGCLTCFNRGEEFCPIMKIFLDRLGFVFHRPRYFGKVFTSIVVQGIYGGPKVVEYLDLVGNGLGFNVVRGSCVTALDPMTEREQRKIDSILAAQSKWFHERLLQPSYPVPSLFKLMLFRNARTRVRLMLNESNRDYTYYRDNGWFESDYFYPTHLNVFKKAAGKLFDYTISRSVKKSADGSDS